ncbi:MAG: CBS domain-containing protein [Betaproteobacteria bacterium]|nr:CBS domain-containing protein [Betaproteobacteria bacterium]
MRKVLDRFAIGSGLALLPLMTFAVQLEETQAFVGMGALYALGLITLIAAVFVCFRQQDDKRAVPLRTILNGTAVTYSVQAEALILDCVLQMTERKIGALMVMDGEKPIGIFTERDALTRVLAAGRDPRGTKVCEVMTMNPCCVSPETTVGDALALVASRRFRHLPIVENGRVRTVLSSRDLTRWLVKERAVGAQELLDLAIRS